jgi:serine/threonine protein kinase
MRPGPGRLESLVASVADGWPQDWTALEAGTRDERTRHVLRNMRLVTAIADFHRNSPASRSLDGTDTEPNASESSASLARDPLIPEASPPLGQWGRFLLRKKLGQGSFGEVYSAYDPQLNRDVALKLLKPSRSSPDQAPRLLSEARMLAQVRHPNVASVYGADQYDGRAGMWMELVRGLTLEELIHSHGAMSAGEAALVGQCDCRALIAVHRAGLVHRDVKTANVIREYGGRIVLTDFGAGRFRGIEPKGGVVGTPHYVAPEVMAGGEATELSDIYSVGVLLYRLVTVSYPCPIPAFDEPPESHDSGPPTSLRDLRADLSEAFSSAVEQALSRDPRHRPRSAGALSAALGIALGASASLRRARPAPGKPTSVS